MIVMHVHFTVKEEEIERFKASLIANAIETQKEEGCIRFDMMQDQANPKHFALVEIWRDKEAQDFHLSQPYFLNFKEIALEVREENHGWHFDWIYPDAPAPKVMS